MSSAARKALASRTPSARPDERALAVLWQNVHNLADGLVTEDGRRFRVAYPGRANHRAGPDFHDTVIVTDAGELVSGDVELHVDASNWRGHGHQNDPNYNGVILHVVFRPRGRTTSPQQSKMDAPIVSVGHLAPLMEREQEDTPELQDLAVPSRQEDLGRLLDEAGDQRFLGRSRGFVLDMEEVGPEQALYRALMDALGYASNRKPFRELAQRLPIAGLLSLRDEPPTTRYLALKALLLHGAGLLGYVEPPEEEPQLRNLLRCLARSRPMSARRWALFRVRPANHPARRIVGAAHLIDRYAATGLVEGLADDVRCGDAGWLVKKRLSAPPFVGRGRAGDMAVNVVLPALHAWAGLRRDSKLRETCLELFRSFPKLSENEITREMRRLLAPRGAAVDAATSRRQQGLMHLYRSQVRRPGRQRKPPFGDAAASGPEAGALGKTWVTGRRGQPGPVGNIG